VFYFLLKILENELKTGVFSELQTASFYLFIFMKQNVPACFQAALWEGESSARISPKRSQFCK
jgi:hypothetical protein